MSIYQRDVPWSSIKQMRTVVETEPNVDDVYEYLLSSFRYATLRRHYTEKLGMSKQVSKAAAHEINPFVCVERNAGIKIQYKQMRFPW